MLSAKKMIGPAGRKLAASAEESCAMIRETGTQNGPTPKMSALKPSSPTNRTQASITVILTGLMTMACGGTLVLSGIRSMFLIGCCLLDGNQVTLFLRSPLPRTSTEPIWTLHCTTGMGNQSTLTCGLSSGTLKIRSTRFRLTQPAHRLQPRRKSRLLSNSLALIAFRRSSRTTRPRPLRFDRVTPLKV